MLTIIKRASVNIFKINREENNLPSPQWKWQKNSKIQHLFCLVFEKNMDSIRQLKRSSKRCTFQFELRDTYWLWIMFKFLARVDCILVLWNTWMMICPNLLLASWRNSEECVKCQMTGKQCNICFQKGEKISIWKDCNSNPKPVC